MGKLRQPPGAQMAPKRWAKGSPKASRNDVFKLMWEMGKCGENVLFATLWPHPLPPNTTFWIRIGAPKSRSKPGGNQIEEKLPQNGRRGLQERAQSPNLVLPAGLRPAKLVTPAKHAQRTRSARKLAGFLDPLWVLGPWRRWWHASTPCARKVSELTLLP